MLDVRVFVVEGSGFPEAEDDADPFVGQGTDGGVVLVAGGAFHLVERFGPAAPLAGLVGEFVERLPERASGKTSGLGCEWEKVDTSGRGSLHARFFELHFDREVDHGRRFRTAGVSFGLVRRTVGDCGT